MNLRYYYISLSYCFGVCVCVRESAYSYTSAVRLYRRLPLRFSRVLWSFTRVQNGKSLSLCLRVFLSSSLHCDSREFVAASNGPSVRGIVSAAEQSLFAIQSAAAVFRRRPR